MATTEQVQELLRNYPLAKVGDLQDSYFPLTIGSGTAKLLNSEVDDYLNKRDTISINPETAVYTAGYYEHVVDILNNAPVFSRLFKRDEEQIILQNDDSSLVIQLGPCSPTFLLAVFDKNDKQRLSFLRRRAPLPRYATERQSRTSTEDIPHLKDIFGRMVTVRVEVFIENKSRYTKSKLLSIAEAALFNISYARGIGLSLSRSWERSYYRLGVQREQDIQLPRRTYNSDLLAYYHLALSSDSSILAYLSLYKILEYFYLSTAESVLHKRLQDKLVSPSFSHKHTPQLRELVVLVRKFDQKTDEQKMLSNVIEKYLMSDEVSHWIGEYEKSNGLYYTVQQTVLGLSHTVDLNASHYASSLAKRIYHIRNALVHNKEGELPRFIPFTGQDEILIKELPLLLFMAETLIVKTGEDL